MASAPKKQRIDQHFRSLLRPAVAHGLIQQENKPHLHNHRSLDQSFAPSKQQQTLVKQVSQQLESQNQHQLNNGNCEHGAKKTSQLSENGLGPVLRKLTLNENNPETNASTKSRIVLAPIANGTRQRVKQARHDLNLISYSKRKNLPISQIKTATTKSHSIDFSDPQTYYTPPPGLEELPGVQDFDRSQLRPSDPSSYSEPHYAWDIYLSEKAKESSYKINKYLGRPNNSLTNISSYNNNIFKSLTASGGESLSSSVADAVLARRYDISPKMRAVLVDWMVQMQDGLALNHEALYMAVKIVDLYLMRKPVSKQHLQLLGLTALLIACKFDERLPPEIDEFLDNTKGAYTRRQVILFEMDTLKTLDFDLSFPLSYRFLRRYARCTGCDMRTLTLARYILESSLLEYEFIDELESKIAAATLCLAFKMVEFEGGWSDAAVFYTQYTEDDLLDLLLRLNALISKPVDRRVSFVRCKYKNAVFLQVAEIPPLATSEHLQI